MPEKYVTQNAYQTKQLVAGGSLVDVMHVDVLTAEGFPLFVDIPVGQATPDNIDKAIQDKISKLRAIMNLGR